MSWKWLIGIIVVSLVNVYPYPTSFTMAEDVVDSFAFDVQPGGDKHMISRSLGQFECHFLYGAQGGTNEEWYMTMSADHDAKKFKCYVGRPTGTSYLLFETFKMSVFGANLKTVAAYSGMEEHIDESEYTLNYEQNEVAANENFQKQLSLIEVTAEGVKLDL